MRIRLNAFAAAAAFTCLGACATFSNPSSSGGNQALPNIHDKTIGFIGTHLTYTCQEDPDLGRIPGSVQGNIRDLKAVVPALFHLKIIWRVDRSREDVTAEAITESIKPHIQKYTRARLEAIGQELLDRAIEKCVPPPSDGLTFYRAKRSADIRLMG